MMSVHKQGDLEEEGNTTIYHVPSFLLKTYEIVDVSKILLSLNDINQFYRIRNMILLSLGQVTESLSL